VVIADESHCIKSFKAQRTKAIVPLLKSARRAILLTGTPAISRPIELFTQIDAVAPGKFGKKTAYEKRYCDGKRSRFGWQVWKLSCAQVLVA